MSVVDTVIGKANKVVTIVKPHLPTIGIVGGGIAVCVGGFMTGRATLRVDQILNDHKDMIDETRRENNGFSEEQYTEIERKKDIVQIYSITAGKLFRLYAPGLGICAAGFACMFYGLGTLRKWHALAVSAVAAIDEQFSDYRGNVIKELGVEADKKFLLGDGYSEETKEHAIETTEINEDGEEVKTSKNVYAIENLVEDDFTRVFNYKNKKWEGDYLMNDRLFVDTQNWYTKHLRSNRIDHVFLNSILKELGYSETGIGHFYGWTNKPGCYVGIQVTPYIEIWSSDEDGQFPLYVPFPTAIDDESGNWFFVNEDDEETFRKAYIEDERKVGYFLKFLVDTDENGVPKNIYDDVYGTNPLKKIG